MFILCGANGDKWDCLGEDQSSVRYLGVCLGYRGLTKLGGQRQNIYLVYNMLNCDEFL